MEGKKLETMTVSQVVDELRALGDKTTANKVRAGIIQGVYPFGIHIEMENEEFEIYRKKFDEWVNERVS